MQQRAAPTSQWFSTIAFQDQSNPVFVQPMTVRATPAGLEMALPTREVRPTERRDTEVAYVHKDPILLAPAAFEPGHPLLAGTGDWSVDISFPQGQDDMRISVAHGNPFAYVRLSRGDLLVRLPFEGRTIDTPGDPRVLALDLHGKGYAIFGPTGSRWERQGVTQWLLHLPADRRYVAAAVLPEETPQAIALLGRHAYVHVIGTKVAWRYDVRASRVETTFTAQTAVMEGPDNGPIYGLYPHQWYGNPGVEQKLSLGYDSIRGKIRLLEADSFSTSYPYTGFVPFWPGVAQEDPNGQLADVMKSDLRNARRLMLPEGQSAYWQGKGLQRIVELLNVVEQQGDREGAARLLSLLEKRMTEWLSGDDPDHCFFRDSKLGAVGSYPDDFFAIEQINDHHFWYGYWIRSAAEIALRDPAWAGRDQWGRMIDLLVADIATTERGGREFPFLRNFDPYEGHSWANGLGGVGSYGTYGNNQESSSEAINAWVGLVLWGEVTGDTRLRDLGAYLYATESQAVSFYWFDVHHVVFDTAYQNPDVAQLFGGKYIHNTWWTDEPREVTGINLLPLTTASTHLARYPRYIEDNLQGLHKEEQVWASRGKQADPKDIWQDILAEYQALADPDQATRAWDRWGSVELGETRSHTLHWLLSLKRMGAPDPGVTADTPLYAVFRRKDGARTYLAYNAGKTPIHVTFSDGMTLDAPPGQLVRSPSR